MFYQLILAGSAALLVGAGVLRERRRRCALAGFANSRRLNYFPSDVLNLYPRVQHLAIAGLGHDRNLFDIVTGITPEGPVTVCGYQYEIGSGSELRTVRRLLALLDTGRHCGRAVAWRGTAGQSGNPVSGSQNLYGLPLCRTIGEDVHVAYDGEMTNARIDLLARALWDNWDNWDNRDNRDNRDNWDNRDNNEPGLTIEVYGETLAMSAAHGIRAERYNELFDRVRRLGAELIRAADEDCPPPGAG